MQSERRCFLGGFWVFCQRGAKKGSDIDIAIEFDKNREKTLLDLIGLEQELSKLFRRKVDLGVFSSLNPYVIDDVKREMRVIYEKR